MEILDKFLLQEERNGFTVNEVMKRSWAAYIEILDDIIEICNKHSLKLFASYGTLLGAVREHGFIPWDDDVDVGLVGMDYVNFLEILSKEYGDKYTILNPYTRTWYSMNFTHITNAPRTSFKREDIRRWHGCPFVTGLDVYPYYYVPRNESDERFILNLLGKIDDTIAMNRELMSMVDGSRIVADNNVIGKEVALKLIELQRETGYEFSNDRPIENQLEILYDQVCRITPEEDADFVVRYDEYFKDRTRKIPKDHFEKTLLKSFEYISIPVPIGYDAILTDRFGHDYIMPRNIGAAHDYPYYSKQLKDEKYYREELESEKRPRYGSVEIKRSPRKKNVLYHTGMREMLIHCEKAPEKIKSVLRSFSINEEYELWWMPDVFLKNDDIALDEVAPDLMKQYESIIHDFIEKGCNVCDIGTDIGKAINECDEYYGDPGVIADSFREAGKKTTIQNYSVMGIEADEKYRIDEDIEEAGTIVKSIDDEIPDVPEEWKKNLYRSDGSRKKIILFITTLSVLYHYKEKTIDKWKSVIKIFREKTNDIALIWKCEPILSDVKPLLGSKLVQDFDDLVNLFRKEQVGILIEGEADHVVSLVDAIYGDSDALMRKAIESKIPVMIENPEII